MKFFIPIFVALCIYNYSRCADSSQGILSNFILHPNEIEARLGEDGRPLTYDEYLFREKFFKALENHQTMQQPVFATACIHALPVSIRYALDAGASPNELIVIEHEKTKLLVTPLCLIARGNSITCANVLLYKKAAIDGTSFGGLTALHTACLANNAEMVGFLLDKGADITKQDQAGKTPLDLAPSTKILNLFAPYQPDWGDQLD